MTMHQQYANYAGLYHHPPQSHPSVNFYGSFDSSTEDIPAPAPTAAVVPTIQPGYVADAPKKVQPRKQTRNQYTKEQKAALEQSYLDGIYVSIRRREEMARELNLTAKQVKVWYQNRRQKDKRRDSKLKKPQTTAVVIKVPPSADSPDSGVQDVVDESHHYHHNRSVKLDVQQQQQMAYQDQVSNKVGALKSSPSSHHPQLQGKAYESPIYAYLAAAATGSASHPHHYAPAVAAPFDYSQAFANYYNNYDYHGAYQYYQQFMSGYQSHQQQPQHFSADPQEAETYAAY